MVGTERTVEVPRLHKIFLWSELASHSYVRHVLQTSVWFCEDSVQSGKIPAPISSDRYLGQLSRVPIKASRRAVVSSHLRDLTPVSL